jgi:hypothetical protein
MFRKTIIALAAVGALGAAAIAPTTASAWGWHGGWHGHFWGPGVYAGPVYYNSCLHRQWVDTPYGPRLRWINVCY